ncbi:MAG: lipid-A-disaccharide synthase [Pseudomonadota bacterium]
MKVGIIAGEVSGDILASSLINEIKRLVPEATFVGIAGPLMIEAGCKTLYPMNKLSVMGLVEVVANFRELYVIQADIIKYFLKNPPDVFIAVDAPDFNLAIEKRLKEKNIRTVHYVSPSVWAWRQYRIHKICRSVGLMLTLFPFEKRFYDNYYNYHNCSMPVKFVGHTLADEIPLDVDKLSARLELGIDTVIQEHQALIAVLPGSRNSEIQRLSKPFLDTIVACQKINTDLVFIAPLVSQEHRKIFEKQIKSYQNPPKIILVDGNSRVAMAASDAVLLASGTATLEALLLKKPMLVAYKLAPITYWITRKLAAVPYFSLPNLLSGEKLVEELAQEQVNEQNMVSKVLALLDLHEWKERLDIFHNIHLMLRKEASKTAAQAVVDYVNKPVKVQTKK